MSQSPSKITISKSYLRGWVQLLTLVREHGLSLSGREANCCFLNTGQTRFANIAGVSGLDFIDDARGCAVVDWDKDGDLDMWVSNRTAPQIRYLRNDVSQSGNFVAFHLTGTKSNRDAIGARISLTFHGDDKQHIKSLRAGEGFLSQSSKWMHFGIGDQESIQEVKIRWPDGSEDKFYDLSANRFYQLIQGDTNLQRVEFSSEQLRQLAPAELQPEQVESKRTVIAPREKILALHALGKDGEEFFLKKTVSGPTLVNLWSETCAPCIQEMAEFSEAKQRLDDAGVSIVALRAPNPREDGAASVKQLRSYVEKLELPFRAAAATDRSMQQLTKAQHEITQIDRPVGLPTSFLVDSKGRLSVLYRGRVSVDQVLEDAKRVDAEDADWNASAMPFPGKWFDSPFE